VNSFLLFEQFKLDELLGRREGSALRGLGAHRTRSKTSLNFRVLPLGARGHRAAQRARRRAGLPLEDGKVKTPEGFKAAWKSLYEAGWKSIAVDPSTAAPGAPSSLQVLVEEMISGANTAFSMYSG
jgi:alkylation response protein AidB-like acyl-CoA dehydrogenase